QASAHPEAAPAEYTEETNLRGPRFVFEAALRHRSPPIVYGSSFHVYGSGLAGEIDEGRPYGVLRDLSHLSKVYAEKLGELYAATRGLSVTPVRLGIVYGLGPVVKRDLRFVTVPHAFCLRALAGQPLRIHPSGMAPLAFVHLDDAVDALRLAAEPRGYAPANAAAEVATALEVARLVQAAAWSSGRDAIVQTHAPDSPALGQEAAAPPAPLPSPRVGEASEGAERRGPAPGGVRGHPFIPTSRLSVEGWRPQRRLAETVPAIFDYYASRGAPTGPPSDG
ncbi:MAG: NAD-dependent epimerase/dehydratase family protein, partial [Chloroflexota bacterium]